MDDASDYEFGLSNVQPGMAAAPALYAIEEHPELLPIITRYLSREGDVECVGITHSFLLTWTHCRSVFP